MDIISLEPESSYDFLFFRTSLVEKAHYILARCLSSLLPKITLSDCNSYVSVILSQQLS